jgi:hypothetical protein
VGAIGSVESVIVIDMLVFSMMYRLIYASKTLLFLIKKVLKTSKKQTETTETPMISTNTMQKSVKNIGVFETIGTPKHPRLACRSLAAVEICL